MWVELFTTSELQLIVADLNLHIKAADGLFSNLDSDSWINPQTPQKNTNLYGSMSVLQHDVTLTLDQASKFPRIPQNCRTRWICRYPLYTYQGSRWDLHEL